ncbi:alanine racemase [Ruania zhangjianzhongii]|uniref:alanine racemase n=1 Tax=Ruania zhangjianzhongii TaxID=2603206 RepID=UPI00314503B8
MRPAQSWRPAPWREATRTFSAPLAVVDLDRFDANAADLLARAGGLPLRLASKSVRVRHLTHRALELGFTGVMAYSLAEALWLAEDGIDDVLLAYPSVDTAALVRLASTPAARDKITVMIDDVSQVALVERAFIRAGSPEGPPVNVCLDIDASLRLGVGAAHVHLGVRRSPVRTPEEAVALARSVQRTGRMRVRGVMFYEAQVAGMPETGVKAPAIRLIKGLTMLELAGRRPAVVTALEEHLGRPMLVNGGGTGSVQQTGTDPTITEITAGSGLYCPTLFDSYDAFTPRPAAFFGLDVVRRPARGIVTAFGGGYVASGPRPIAPVCPARWTAPGWSPPKAPGRCRHRCGTRAGGTVARSVPGSGCGTPKRGEAMERFDAVHLVRGTRVLQTVPTYRGEGRNFG